MWRKVLSVAVLSALGSPASAAELDLRVRANDKAVYFTARSGGPFESCNVILNDGYKATVDLIDASGKANLWWTEFTRGSLRFDPSAERVRRVHVLCARPYGSALFAPN